MAGSKNANGSGELVPESGAGSDSQSSTLPSARDVLAGKPAGEHIDRSESGVNLPDIGGNRDGRPMTVEDGGCVAVLLARPRELEACVVESEVEAAAAAEEGADIHCVFSLLLLAPPRTRTPAPPDSWSAPESRGLPSLHVRR